MCDLAHEQLKNWRYIITAWEQKLKQFLDRDFAFVSRSNESQSHWHMEQETVYISSKNR